MESPIKTLLTGKEVHGLGGCGMKSSLRIVLSLTGLLFSTGLSAAQSPGSNAGNVITKAKLDSEIQDLAEVIRNLETAGGALKRKHSLILQLNAELNRCKAEKVSRHLTFE